MTSKPIRFHWSMSSAGETFRGARARAQQSGMPDLEAYIAFCRLAEQCDMDSVLTAFGFHRPDPMVMAAALGAHTSALSFMVAVRSGLFSPTVFVQQVNSVAAWTGGRICLNLVAGHTPSEQRGYGDFLDHEARYDRSDEFLTICRALWEREAPVDFEGKYYRVEGARLNTPFQGDNRGGPEIFLGGASPRALELARKHAHCLWTLPRPPEEMKERFQALLQSGTEVGLLVSILARATHERALADSERMLVKIGGKARKTHRDFSRKSDSVAFTSTIGLAEESASTWLTPWLWTGAVPYLGAPAIALVGSYEEVASAILEFREAGITQFLFMGWPDEEEMVRFHRHVKPLVRAGERFQVDLDDGSRVTAASSTSSRRSSPGCSVRAAAPAPPTARSSVAARTRRSSTTSGTTSRSRPATSS